MHIIRSRASRFAAVAAVATGVLLACNDEQDPNDASPTAPSASLRGPVAEAACYGVNPVVVSGAINSNRTLTSNNTYLLRGVVNVNAPATLTVEAGTCVLGDADQRPSALVINRGARIIADGTAANPITFTSSRQPGQRAPGNWGGITIIGRSICNQPTQSQCTVEGIPGTPKTYGQKPPILGESSGSLQFVRIQFAGFQLVANNELNGLTLYGVGRGTTLNNIQVHRGSDDGFEFFGGSVNASRLLSSHNSDDSFDYSFGYAGFGQFWVAQQRTDDGDKGFEVDNDEDDFANTPETEPQIFNVTLVGRRPGSAGGGQNTGIHFRRGTAGDVYNAIVLGFATSGLDVDDALTYDNCGVPASGTRLILGNSIINNSGATYDPDVDGEPGDPTAETRCVRSIRTVAPSLDDPFNRNNPDFRPNPGSPARTGARTPPNGGGFFQAVTYIGGVAPEPAAQFFQAYAQFPSN